MRRLPMRRAERVTTAEAQVVVEHVVINRAADCRTRGAAGCTADESGDHRAGETTKDGTDWAGKRADNSAGFGAR